MRAVYDYGAIKRRVAELEAQPIDYKWFDFVCSDEPSLPPPQQPPPPKITRGEDNEENAQSGTEEAGAKA